MINFSKYPLIPNKYSQIDLLFFIFFVAMHRYFIFNRKGTIEYNFSFIMIFYIFYMSFIVLKKLFISRSNIVFKIRFKKYP